jgi:photosystem II stability/assembly factor-like uncharacterized protein
MIRNLCRVFAALLIFPASAHSLPNGGPALDVGPEAGIVFGNTSQPFLFRGTQEVLVTSGRAGIYKRGLVDASGVEPYAQGLCQSHSAPEIAYVVSLRNELSRTDDFGDNWGPLALTTNPTLSDCAVDPTDPSMVYALARSFDPIRSGQLFKSIDAGRTFSVVGAGLPQLNYANAVKVAPTNAQTVYVLDWGTSAGLYVSSDGGINFEALRNPPTFVYRVYPHPTEDGTLVVLAANGLFISTDGGTTFAQAGSGLPLAAGHLAFDPIEPSVVYASAGVDGLFRSIDGAGSFVHLDGLGEDQLRGAGVNTVGVSRAGAEDRAVVYAGTALGPFRSDDDGQTFVRIRNGYRGTQVNDLAVDAAGRLLVATINSAGVFRSSSTGIYQILSGTLSGQVNTSLTGIAAAPDDAEVCVVGAYGSRPGEGGIFRTTDGGGSWTRAAIPGDPLFGFLRIAFAPSDSSRVYVAATYPGGLYRSNDGGLSFTRLSFAGLGAIAVDTHDPNLLYVGSSSDAGALFKSTDGGVTLQQLGASGNFVALALDPQRPQVIYAGRRVGGPIRSLDGGQTFELFVQGLAGDGVLGLGVDPLAGQPARIFVWMRAGGLFRSDDGADTWTAVDVGETLRRSTAQTGQTALTIQSGSPERVYVGNGSVLQVEITE